MSREGEDPTRIVRDKKRSGEQGAATNQEGASCKRGCSRSRGGHCHAGGCTRRGLGLAVNT